MIDTHCHIYLEQFEEDRADVVERARDAGVRKMLLPNIDASTIKEMLVLERRHPNVIFAMMGLHPCSVGQDYQDQLATVRHWLDKRSFVAVGEIGTDHYWDTSFAKEQEECFRKQLGWAAEFQLPVAIHSRESLDLNIGIVREMQDGSLSGVFHCFNGTKAQGEEIMDLGFYLGIGGVVTFKNAGVDKAVSQLPLSAMVLETDAPYLTPSPYRGKRNEPSYLTYIAHRIADLHGIPLSAVVDQTDRNVKDLFPKAISEENF